MSKPKGVFVTGIDTEIGKTVVSALIVEALGADYWKPVQSGDLDYSDTDKVRRYTGDRVGTFHPEQYRLNTPISPHASAAIDQVTIELEAFRLPQTHNFLVVEGAGGLMVPLNEEHCIIDLIKFLGLPVVLVSKHYLGSINHTLLSIEALKRRNIPIAALIFNGPATPTTEAAIEQFGGLSSLLRLPPLPAVNRENIAAAAASHRPALQKALLGVTT